MKPTLISLVTLSLLLILISPFPELEVSSEVKWKKDQCENQIAPSQSSCSSISIEGYTCCYVEDRQYETSKDDFEIYDKWCTSVNNLTAKYDLEYYTQNELICKYSDAHTYNFQAPYPTILDRIRYPDPSISNDELKKKAGIFSINCGGDTKSTKIPEKTITDDACYNEEEPSLENCKAIKPEGSTCCYVETEYEYRGKRKGCIPVTVDFEKDLKKNLERLYENEYKRLYLELKKEVHDKTYINAMEKENYGLGKTTYICGEEKVELKSFNLPS